MTSLDILGPLAYLNRVPGINIFFIHDNLSPVPSGNGTLFTNSVFAGQYYQPMYTLDNAPPLDVLIIPGGFGTWPLVDDPKWARFVAKVYPNLQYLYSVCTGAAVVARAGLINGKRATTNKAYWDWVTSNGPHVHWVSEARWVIDGNIWTSSGMCHGFSGGSQSEILTSS